MGCYGGSGLFPTVNNNVLALCQLWSSRVDNYTAVCTKCSNPNDNTKKYLPDITGQYCYEITSFKLKSLIANC